MINPATIYPAHQLLNSNFSQPVQTVPELLSSGLGILAGRPKIGKSWMGLQLALSVGSGGMFLGKQLNKAAVLYLALEDSPRRLKDRMNNLLWPNDPSIKVDFIVLSDFLQLIGPFHKNGAINLRDNFIKSVGYKLVIIDTLSRAFLGINDIDRNQEVTKALSPIQEIGQQMDCSILILDHHNKGAEGRDPNPINDILGSTAKAAVLDTAWGLYREKGKHTASLMVTGRDVEEQTLTIKRDYVTMAWQLENPTSNSPLHLSPIQTKLLDYIRDNGPTVFADFYKNGGFNRGNAWQAIQELLALGEVNKDPKTGEYYL